MKMFLSLSVALFFCSIYSHSAKAWEQVQVGVVCEPSSNAFEEFKTKGYEPRILGANSEVSIVVWLTEKGEMLVTNTLKNKGVSITCIVNASLPGSEVLDAPAKNSAPVSPTPSPKQGKPA